MLYKVCTIASVRHLDLILPGLVVSKSTRKHTILHDLTVDISRVLIKGPSSATPVKTHKLLQVCKQVVTSLFTSCQQIVFALLVPSLL